MVPGDARSRWPENLLTDRRVEHFWDEARIVGRWYAERAASMRGQLTAESEWNDGPVLWDSYLLYGADSRWDEGGAPTNLIQWGRTVVASRAPLRELLDSKY
jgi:hypothetical protein